MINLEQSRNYCLITMNDNASLILPFNRSAKFYEIFNYFKIHPEFSSKIHPNKPGLPTISDSSKGSTNPFRFLECITEIKIN